MNNESTKDKSAEHLLEQWKFAAEMADRVSARRIDTNKLYVSLLTGLFAIIPFVLDTNSSISVQKTVFIIMGFMGLALCSIWIINLRSYKQLNSLKFKVIHEMEQTLPFPYFAREWEVLKEQPNRGYLRLSKVEQFVPLLLLIPYVILLAYALFFM